MIIRRLGGLFLSAVLAACAADDAEDTAGQTDDALTNGRDVLVNEVLANEPGGDVASEFVELVNVTARDVSLDGWSLSDGVRVRHVFPAGTTIKAGGVLVTFGYDASTGTLDLSNGGDTLSLVRGDGSVVETVTYGRALARDEGVSFVRVPEADPRSRTFQRHTQVSQQAASPGTRADGRPFGRAPATAAPKHDGKHLRVVAANLTTGNRASYDAGEGARILDGLEPDLTLIQELNVGDNSPAAIERFVRATHGAGFSYFREDRTGMPNGIISRYPIVAAGSWDDPHTSDRDLAWARIEVPGPTPLWAVSVHLRTANGGVRAEEAALLVSLIRSHVPSSDYLVIGGDLNTVTRGEPCIGTLSAVVKTSGPYPSDQAQRDGTNASRAKPYDWVLVDPKLDARQVPTVLGSSSFPNGLVFDSRVYRSLADVAPVQRGDSAAAEMQHMAVVRDFTLP